MKVRTILDEVELTLRQRGLKGESRPILLKHLNFDLTELSGKEDWDWAMVHLDPAVALSEGKREYDLAGNFTDNFVRYSGDEGEGFVCLLDDGSNKAPIGYESPMTFFARNLTAESNGRPARYTIVSKPDGSRQILVSPPPDAAATYTLDGLYIPTDWALKEEDDTPPIPGHSAILKWALLRRYDFQTFGAYYMDAFATLMMRLARNRKAKIGVNQTPYR